MGEGCRTSGSALRWALRLLGAMGRYWGHWNGAALLGRRHDVAPLRRCPRRVTGCASPPLRCPFKALPSPQHFLVPTLADDWPGPSRARAPLPPAPPPFRRFHLTSSHPANPRRAALGESARSGQSGEVRREPRLHNNRGAWSGEQRRRRRVGTGDSMGILWGGSCGGGSFWGGGGRRSRRGSWGASCGGRGVAGGGRAVRASPLGRCDGTSRGRARRGGPVRGCQGSTGDARGRGVVWG